MTRRDSKQEIVARTLIENVQVAAVGQKLQPGSSEQADKSGKGKPARAVTLLCRPEFVPKLHLAEQRGKIKLSMRNEIEGNEPDKVASSTTEDEILGVRHDNEKQEPGFMDKLTAMFQARSAESAKAQAAVAANPPQAPEAPAEPPKPPPAWVMNVWNGDRCERLGWARMTPSNRRRSTQKRVKGPRRRKAAAAGPATCREGSGCRPPSD